MHILDVKTMSDIYTMIGGACWCETTTEGYTSEHHRIEKEGWLKVATAYHDEISKLPVKDGQSWDEMQQKLESFLRGKIAEIFSERIEFLLTMGCLGSTSIHKLTKMQLAIIVNKWVTTGDELL